MSVASNERSRAGERRAAALVLVGGIDPTGGAGLLRDVWAARQREFEGRVFIVPSAWTWQGEGQGEGPAQSSGARVQALAAARFDAALARVSRSLNALPHSGAVGIKVGLMPEMHVGAMATWLEALRRQREPGRGPWMVVDPVLRASEGGAEFTEPTALAPLLSLADVMTPNVAEYRELTRRGWRADTTACLVKSAAANEAHIVDHLLLPHGNEVEIESERVAGPDPRGTGCALATAIAVELIGGASIEAAARRAIAWLHGARRHTHPGVDGRAHLGRR